MPSKFKRATFSLYHKFLSFFGMSGPSGEDSQYSELKILLYRPMAVEHFHYYLRLFYSLNRNRLYDGLKILEIQLFKIPLRRSSWKHEFLAVKVSGHQTGSPVSTLLFERLRGDTANPQSPLFPSSSTGTSGGISQLFDRPLSSNSSQLSSSWSRSSSRSDSLRIKRADDMITLLSGASGHPENFHYRDATLCWTLSFQNHPSTIPFYSIIALAYMLHENYSLASKDCHYYTEVIMGVLSSVYGTTIKVNPKVPVPGTWGPYHTKPVDIDPIIENFKKSRDAFIEQVSNEVELEPAPAKPIMEVVPLSRKSSRSSIVLAVVNDGSTEVMSPTKRTELSREAEVHESDLYLSPVAEVAAAPIAGPSRAEEKRPARPSDEPLTSANVAVPMPCSSSQVSGIDPMSQQLAQLLGHLGMAICQNRNRIKTVETYRSKSRAEEVLALESRDHIIQHGEYLIENWEKHPHSTLDHGLTRVFLDELEQYVITKDELCDENQIAYGGDFKEVLERLRIAFL